MDLFLENQSSPTILVYYEKVNFRVSTKLTHNCKSYQLNIFMEQPLFICILGDFPESLYDRNLLSDNKSLNKLKTYPWKEPHEIFYLLQLKM